MSTKTKNKKTNKSQKKNEVNGLGDLETIAADLDAIARKHLPDGIIQNGILAGSEAEIRQEALILAVGGFLEQNHGFRDARANQDQVAIRNAKERCMAIALGIAKKRVAGRLNHIQTHECQLAQTNFGSIDHPSQCHPNNWPPDLKSRLIMRAVGKAVDCGQLSLGNASIVYLVCERGMAVQQVASVAKITRSAVYQQIDRARRVLPKIMETIEANFC